MLCIFQNNKYLKDLNLSHNMFGEEGGEILGAAIGRNRKVSCFTIHVLYFLIFNWYLNIFSIEMFVLLCGCVITTSTEFI